MTLIEAVRRALMAGLGAQVKVKELIDELIKKGELSETQGARLVREWSERVDKSTSDLGKSISELLTKTLEKMNVPTRDEVEKLNREVQGISTRLKKLEEAMAIKEPAEE